MDLALYQLEQALQLPATCQPHDSLTDFNAELYMGTWFEQVHTVGSAFQSSTDVCGQAIYSDLTDDGHFSIYNSAQKTLDKPRSGVHGDGYCPDSTGGCYVHFYGPGKDRPNYTVIDTDYSTYTVVYACSIRQENVWLITRDAVMSDELHQQMLDIVSSKLPTFDQTRFNHVNVQGSECAYVSEASRFLQ